MDVSGDEMEVPTRSPLDAVGLRRTVHWDKFGIQPEPEYWPAFPDGWWYDLEKAARIR